MHKHVGEAIAAIDAQLLEVDAAEEVLRGELDRLGVVREALGVARAPLAALTDRLMPAPASAPPPVATSERPPAGAGRRPKAPPKPARKDAQAGAGSAKDVAGWTYEQVAVVARAAAAKGESMLAAVAARFEVSETTAGGRLQECRRRGLLPKVRGVKEPAGPAVAAGPDPAPAPDPAPVEPAAVPRASGKVVLACESCDATFAVRDVRGLRAHTMAAHARLSRASERTPVPA